MKLYYLYNSTDNGYVEPYMFFCIRPLYALRARNFSAILEKIASPMRYKKYCNSQRIAIAANIYLQDIRG